MNFLRLVPMLETTSLQETIEFYESKLAFTCEELDSKRGWAYVKKGSVSLMFALPHAHTTFDRPTFTGSLYLYTDQVDELWLRLKDQVKIGYEIESFDYGMREFAIYDNNGYLLQFGQSLYC